jgi:protein TonB
MGVPVHLSPLPATAEHRRGLPSVHWGWLAAVAGAHAAGLFALAGIGGTVPAAPLPAQAPAVMVEFITPAAPPAAAPPAAAQRETAPAAPPAVTTPAPPPSSEPPPAPRPVERTPRERAPTPPARPPARPPAAATEPASPPVAPPPPAAAAEGPAAPQPRTADAPKLALAAPSPQTDAPGDPLATIAARADPAYLNNPRPTYPRLSRRRGEEGQVILRVHVLQNGRTDIVEIAESSSHPRLDEAAREAVLGWRFVPARRGESPVDSWLRVPIVFRLEE